MSDFTPTAEQATIIDAFQTGGDMVIEAGAGTGKTSTLKLLSEAGANRRGLYIAYNKSIADEATKTFPGNVECRTAHSLAFATHGYRYVDRLNAPRMKPWLIATALGIHSPLQVTSTVRFKPWQVARLVQDTVARFCYSADTVPGPRHVPFVEGCADMDTLRRIIGEKAKDAWQDVLNVHGELPFTHDYYLKMWELDKPHLNYDFVMLDEAQDANPCIASIFDSQKHAQQVSVGDACQSIYQWRGATDYLSKAAENVDHHLLLSQSFRFGPAVAEEANKWLELLESPIRLQGYDAIPSVLTKLPLPDTILARTNAAVVDEAIGALDADRKVAVVGGLGEVSKFAQAAEELMRGQTTNHRDLQAFSTWTEVQEYVQTKDGRDLAVFVRLIDEHGPQRIQDIASATVSEARADIIVSTAHKAKGREWNRVRIAHDFRVPTQDEPEVARPEAMLAYVSVTRAQLELDRGGLHFIDKVLEAQKQRTPAPA